LDSTGIQG